MTGKQVLIAVSNGIRDRYNPKMRLHVFETNNGVHRCQGRKKIGGCSKFLPYLKVLTKILDHF